MKASLLLSLLAATLILTACETRVVERRPHRRVVYATVPGDRVIYRDSRYRGRYYNDDRVIYTTGGTNRDYPRRSVDRTYAF